MNRRALRSRVFAALHDDPAAPVFWAPEEINQALDDGLALWAERIPFVKRQFVVPRRAGTVVYSLAGIDDSIMAPYRLWLPDLKRRLESTSLLELDSRDPHWWTVQGSPWVWAPVDWQRFVVWPVPATTEGFLEVDCYCWPPALLDDEDEPELAPNDHNLLVDYAIALGHLKQWNAEGTMQYLQRFLRAEPRLHGQATLGQTQERQWQRTSQDAE